MVLMQRVVASHRSLDVGLGQLDSVVSLPNRAVPLACDARRTDKPGARGVASDYLSSHENIREQWASAIHIPGWDRRAGNLSFTAPPLLPRGLVTMSV